MDLNELDPNQICVWYDQMKVIDRVNLVLKPHNLVLEADNDEADDYVVYTLNTISKEEGK
jgi:hypothetical protein